MLDNREYDAMPILADALQDAGCTDNELLGLCLATDLKPILAERAVNLIYSEETAAAVRWLEQFAKDIGYDDEDPPTYDYERMVELGYEGVTDGVMHFCTTTGADFFCMNEENQREFFQNWSLVTGVTVPDETLANMSFSCAC
jgi:hypothetical protein